MTDINDIAAAFEKFDLHSHDPKWSSWMLERLFEGELSKPQVSMSDLIRGFDLALQRNSVNLTETVANLVKEVVITAFTRHKGKYSQAEWGWADGELARGASPARCYLFLHAVPPDQIQPGSVVNILEGLENTPRFDEAVATLADDFGRSDVKEALRKWQSNGMTAQASEKIRPFV